MGKEVSHKGRGIIDYPKSYVPTDEGYERLFTQVVFAIINDNNSVGNNLEIFKEAFH